MHYYYRDSKGEWNRIPESSYRAMLTWRGDATRPEMREVTGFMPTNKPTGMNKAGPEYHFMTEKVGKRKKVQR